MALSDPQDSLDIGARMGRVSIRAAVSGVEEQQFSCYRHVTCSVWVEGYGQEKRTTPASTTLSY